MRSTFSRRIGRGVAATATVVLVAAAFAGGMLPASAGQRHAVRAAAVPALPGPVVANAESASGMVVRHTRGVTVTAVTVPASLRAAHASVPSVVYRVRVDGRFPPRAMRYIVSAGTRPVGYGTPSPRGNAAIAITADRAVLTAKVTARYEGGSSLPPGLLHAPSAVHAARSIAASLGPKTAPGLKVATTSYNLGLQAWQPPGLTGKVELVADVHYPKGLPGGPYPIVLFLHGNHDSCYSGSSATYQWPCPAGYQMLPNYEGYDYIAKKLASYGFIVVSVSGNGVNVEGNQVSDTGMAQRGDLLEEHLDLWKTWNTTGAAPFGTQFVGKVDFSKIGVMGHSRGGEGAVWQVIVDRQRTTPYGIDAVLPLAPVDFDRQTVNNVPMTVMLPYCDGDVSDLEGMHFFDDARYRAPGDTTPKGTIVVMGANHNFFNTVWTPSFGYPGSFDDGRAGCPGRITEAQQRKVAQVYITDYFRRYLGGTTSLDKVFTGAKTPTSIAPVQTLTTYMAPDVSNQRLDVDRFTASSSLTSDQLGGTVTATGLTVDTWCAETTSNPCVPGTYESDDVHLTGLPQGVFGWASSTGSIQFNIPSADRNVSGYDVLQFRVGVNPSYAQNNGVALQNLSVLLKDSSGGSVEVPASSVPNDNALMYPPGLPAGHFIMNQIRFPLSQFTGIDLTHVTSVSLVFDQQAKGVVDVSDMAFTKGA
jgi:hypothetical protein